MRTRLPIRTLVLSAATAIAAIAFSQDARADCREHDSWIECGNNNWSATNDSVTLGSDAQTLTGAKNTAVGGHAKAVGDANTAVGGFASAGGELFIKPNGDYDYHIIYGTGTTAIGSDAQAGFGSGGGLNDATAVGRQSRANALDATAVGAFAEANHQNSTAIGRGAQTTRADQIALGTSANTYTLSGVASAASRTAQGTNDPVYLLTTDEAGNLATSTFDLATLETLPAQVQQNSQDITNLTTTVNNHTTALGTHSVLIAQNTNRIANAEVRLDVHQTTLDTHTTQIAVLDTRVTQNTTDIALLDGRIAGVESGLASLGDRVAENLKESRGGTALALAAASLRYDDRPGKLSVAGGVGHFKGQTGLSFGVGYAESDRLRFNAALSGVPQQGDVGFSAGVSWTLN